MSYLERMQAIERSYLKIILASELSSLERMQASEPSYLF